jgi:hypothetical protein
MSKKIICTKWSDCKDEEATHFYRIVNNDNQSYYYVPRSDKCAYMNEGKKPFNIHEIDRDTFIVGQIMES